MSKEIIHQNFNRFPDLTDEEHRMIGFMNAKKIKDYDAFDGVEEISKIIALAFTISGQMMNVEDMQILPELAYNRIMQVYPLVSVEEIKEAVTNGVYDVYGDYFGINPKSILFFISCFLNSRERNDAMERFRQMKSTPITVVRKVTVGEWKKLILKDFELYKNNTSSLIMFDEKKYKLLRRLGLIGLKSKESWNGWLLRAKNSIEYNDTLRAKKKKDKTLLSLVEDFVYNAESGTLTRKEFKRIIIEARKLRYFAFFDYCIKNNIDNIF